MKKQKNNFVIGWIIIIGGWLIIIWGVYSFWRYYLPLASESKMSPKILSPLPESKIDTSMWKTYRNEKYGFEVRYPAKWVTLIGEDSGLPLELWSNERADPRNIIGSYITMPNISFSVTVNPGKLHFPEWFKQSEGMETDFAGEKPQKIFLNSNLVAWAVVLPGLGDGDNTLFISSPDSTYFITAFMHEPYSDLEGTDKQILSTFKFTPLEK